MKRTLLSVMVMLGVSGAAHAENLLDIYQQAQIKDTQLLESKAKRDQAFEKINESRAALLPQINLGAGLNYLQNKNDTMTNTGATGSVTLDQSIYRRSNWVNLDLTEKSATQSDVAYNLEYQNLMLRTAQAYFDVLKAMDTLEFVRANKTAVERQLEQTQQRFEVGLTAITDVHEAEAERDQALADEINAENTLDNSYESLRELTGIDHRQLDVLNTDRFSPQKTAFNSDKWLELALDKNLELHSARIGKDIAKEQIDLAKTGHEPTLDLGAGLNAGYNDYKDEIRNPESNSNQGNIGLNFKLPSTRRGHHLPGQAGTVQLRGRQRTARAQLPLGAEHGALLLQQRERQHRLGPRLQPVRHLRRQRPEGDRSRLRGGYPHHRRRAGLHPQAVSGQAEALRGPLQLHPQHPLPQAGRRHPGAEGSGRGEPGSDARRQVTKKS
jgi:outer membrane protein TolC